jgi:ADP-ribosylglycohydrolase
MLAIGMSILAKGCVDYDDIAARHVAAFHKRKGWGQATTVSVQRMIAGARWWESGEPGAAGNGPPMKMAPLGILHGGGLIGRYELMTHVSNISRMTHLDPRPAAAAMILCDYVSQALRGGPEGLGLNYMRSHMGDNFEIGCYEDPIKHLGRNDGMLCDVMDRIPEFLCRSKDDTELRNAIGARCFVLESFPFTIAMVQRHGHSFEKCLEAIVNQGGDADTNAAMAGAILGAAHGYSSIPMRWRKGLRDRTELDILARGLYEMVMKHGNLL